MPITFPCSRCEAQLCIGSQMAGRSAACPSCRANITIPRFGLSVSGLPAGASATFNPQSTSSTSTLTIQTSNGSKPGMLTITGTSGNLSHTATVTLQLKRK